MPANLYKVLSISGGGYRGYYSASVINCLESLGSTSINDKCDLFAGTSIGGIIAIGLAAGLSSTEIIDGFRAHGEEIFPESFRRNWMSWILCKYNSDKLRQAILRILGEDLCSKPISTLPRDVLVTSVCLESGETCLVSSIDPNYSEWLVIDAALATSAAPTYFAPHQVNGRTFVDGGLSCNVPDIAVLSFILDKLAKETNDIQMLSIGTLHNAPNTTSYKNIRRSAGKIAWGSRIIDVVMDSQRNIITSQCNELFPKDRYYRIDRQVDHVPDLDIVEESLRTDFQNHANKDATEAYKTAFLKSFLSSS